MKYCYIVEHSEGALKLTIAFFIVTSAILRLAKAFAIIVDAIKKLIHKD